MCNDVFMNMEGVMKKKIKKLIDKITNKDVISEDIPSFYYLKNEDLKYGQVEVKEYENDYIEEVFEYNARAAKARVVLTDIKEVKKGYFTVNLIFILVALVVMATYKLLKMEGFRVDYGNQAICVFAVVYLVSRFLKKFNIYLNVLSTLGLLIVHKAFIVAVVVNIILCYMHDRATKKIKYEFGYTDFPTVDLVLCLKNGQYKKIFAREME